MTFQLLVGLVLILGAGFAASIALLALWCHQNRSRPDYRLTDHLGPYRRPARPSWGRPMASTRTNEDDRISQHTHHAIEQYVQFRNDPSNVE